MKILVDLPFGFFWHFLVYFIVPKQKVNLAGQQKEGKNQLKNSWFGKYFFVQLMYKKLKPIIGMGMKLSI